MKSTSKAGGFTLIEILIVIVIIGILSAITSVAVRYAMMTTKASLVGVQINQLSMALDAYKNKYGEYPPDFSDTNAVMLHVKKRWPRIQNINNYADFCTAVSTATGVSFANPWDFDSASSITPCAYVSAIPFWLGGLPDTATGTEPAGFFASPTCPFGVMFDVSLGWIPAPIAQREEMFFKFPSGSVRPFNINGGSAVPVYYINKKDEEDKKPLVYFRPTNVGYFHPLLPLAGTKYYDFAPDSATDFDVVTPYARTASKWYEEDRFQLVHPGLDGSFSVIPDRTLIPTVPVVDWKGDEVVVSEYPGRVPADFTGLTPTDRDNITNFLTGGNTLEGEIQ